MRRIVVVGTSGSGKSTLARQISAQLEIPHIELDAIHHQPNWTPMPAPDFRAAVAERITGDAWVVDGGYRSKLGDLVWRPIRWPGSICPGRWSCARSSAGRWAAH